MTPYIKVLKDIQLTKNFKLSEFICKEGKYETMIPDMELVYKLQQLRDEIGKPIKIVSAYRSPAYNQKCGGSPKSQHKLGKAVDIQIAKNFDYVVDVARKLGFTGIGIYDTFVHLDIRDNPNKTRGYSFWDMRRRR